MDIVKHGSQDHALGTVSAQRMIGSRGVGGAGGGEVQPTNLPLIFWRGRWIILLFVAIAIAGGFYYLSKQTPFYAASSRVLVESGGAKVISIDLGNTSRSANYLATQCELIKSATILKTVSELPELRSMKTFAGVDSPMGLLRFWLSVAPGMKDDLITVTYESAYPDEAAAIVDAVVGSYKSYYASRQKTTAGEVLRVLTKEKRDRDEELQRATADVLAFKQANPSLSFASDRGNVLIGQFAKVSDALATARLDALEATAAYEAASAMKADPARIEQWLQFQGTGLVSPIRAEIEKLEIERASSPLLADSTYIKSLASRLEILKQRVATVATESFDAYLAALNQRATAAQERVTQLQRSFDEQQKDVVDLNTLEIQFATKQAAAQRLEKLCDLLDSRIKEVRLSDEAEPTNITVLEPAKAGQSPVRPKRATILLGVTVLGLMLGCGIAYLRDMTDHRLSSVDEVQSRLGLSVLGVLPHMPGGETPSVRGQKVQLDPMSDIAESYRTIRTAIYFGAPEGRTKRILVTSPAPGDGKTTSASNLAIAMAQAGQRVLLMDCDLRKPMQHRIFGIEDGVGLTSVVAGKISLGKAIKAAPTKGLYILPSGPLPPNPSEILNGQVFAQIMARLEEKFDHIVVDSPPVMPVTDARILGAFCDLTVIVLRVQKSSRRLSEHAVNSMNSVGSRILGVIVNGVPRHKNGYGYGYAGYGYGSYGARTRPTSDQAAAADAQVLEGRTSGARLPSNGSGTAAAAADKANGNGAH
jgi:succinoglycan biosynthesis transport protein ExoP